MSLLTYTEAIKTMAKSPKAKGSFLGKLLTKAEVFDLGVMDDRIAVDMVNSSSVQWRDPKSPDFPVNFWIDVDMWPRPKQHQGPSGFGLYLLNLYSILGDKGSCILSVFGWTPDENNLMAVPTFSCELRFDSNTGGWHVSDAKSELKDLTVEQLEHFANDTFKFILAAWGLVTGPARHEVIVTQQPFTAFKDRWERQKAGASLVFRRVKITPGFVTQRAERDPDHTPAREGVAYHLCRSHSRRLKSGKVVLVRAHHRGDKSKGVVHKTYDVDLSAVAASPP